MATYKQIFGKQVEFLSSDPANEAEGQIWFNSTSDTFKTVVNSGAWVSSAPITTGRYSTASTGTQTASLLMGGNLSPPVGYTAAVEQYNGTGWANETVIPTAIQQGAGAGTITAALFCAGFIGPPPPGSTGTFEYDGSSWTVSNVLANGRTSALSAGTQIAAMIAGGSECPAPVKLSTEEYNGTSWTAGNDMGTSRYQMMGSNVGLQTASLAIGGYGPTGPGPLNNVESYDGTNWTATTVLPVPDGNQARYGIQTAAVAAGGSYTPKVTCVEFDGSAWASMPSLATGRESNSGSGTTTAGVIGGTAPGSPFTLGYTEEYNVATTVVTPGAWATGGVLPTAVTFASGGGTQTAGLSIGGYSGAASTTAEAVANEYDGTSWAAGGSLSSSAKSFGGLSSFSGTQTSMLYWGGYGNSPYAPRDNVSSYDGSSWTAQSVFPSTSNYGGGAGTQTAALSISGHAPSLTTTVMESDGSYNWTAGGALTGAARYSNSSGGPQTAAITAGGGPIGPTVDTEEYDGTSWTAGGALNVTRIRGGGFGAGQNDWIFAGGALPALTTNVEAYNGTSWTTRPSLATARDLAAGSGNVGTSGLIAGGGTPAKTTATEEFTGATTAGNYKTITTS